MTPGERQSHELTQIVDFLRVKAEVWEDSSETLRGVMKMPHPCPLMLICNRFITEDGLLIIQPVDTRSYN